MVVEAYFLPTSTHEALFHLAVKHAMGQSAVRHSDNVAKPPMLAMEEHGFDSGNPNT